MFDCYSYTEGDLDKLGNETRKPVCISYNYHTYNVDLVASDYGCGACECCKSKGCFSGVLQLYNGTWSTSVTGRICQRWDKQFPHSHNRHLGTYPPGETPTQAQNYCRDPDYEGVLWCYTVDPSRRWESCGIPACA